MSAKRMSEWDQSYAERFETPGGLTRSEQADVLKEARRARESEAALLEALKRTGRCLEENEDRDEAALRIIRAALAKLEGT